MLAAAEFIPASDTKIVQGMDDLGRLMPRYVMSTTLLPSPPVAFNTVLEDTAAPPPYRWHHQHPTSDISSRR